VSTVTASAVMAADKVLNEDTVRPGILGLGMFLALAVATFFLWRSMNKQLKKVDAHFAEPAAKAKTEPDAAEPAEVPATDQSTATDATDPTGPTDPE